MISICRRCKTEFQHRHRPGHYCSRACLFGRTPLERFESGYVVDANGCWIWKKAKNERGYGRFSASDGRTVLAHRHSWELTHGPIPDGLFACHKCDVPSCVNPDHLFLGTAADNAADKVAKGRQSRAFVNAGERHPMHRLTVAQVREINSEPTTPRIELAKRYGVTVSTIKAIRYGRIWRNVA